jgi:hypothetical protein
MNATNLLNVLQLVPPDSGQLCLLSIASTPVKKSPTLDTLEHPQAGGLNWSLMFDTSAGNSNERKIKTRQLKV